MMPRFKVRKLPVGQDGKEWFETTFMIDDEIYPYVIGSGGTGRKVYESEFAAIRAGRVWRNRMRKQLGFSK